MNRIPDEVLACIDGVAEVGALDQAFVLVTSASGGPVDVCLLSRTELRATPTSIRLVVASTKARRNLDASGRATLIVVAGNAAHYLGLELGHTIEEDGALAAELEVVRALRDDVGVELHPIRFRVDSRLRVEERWERTTRLLDRLEHAGQGLP